MKKFLSLALALLMVFALCSNAFAMSWYKSSSLRLTPPTSTMSCWSRRGSK